MYKKSLLALSIIFSILFLTRATAQSGYTLLDSCIEVETGFDTLITRTHLIITDSVSYTISEQYTSWNQTWDTIAVSNYILYSYKNTYDSLNRLIETKRLMNSTGQWQYYGRSLFSYDSLGRITDSIQQIYSGNTWIDTLQYSWQKDASGKFIFNESRFFSVGQWNNIQRQEWNYDSLQRDTLQLVFIGNGNQWLPESELHMVYGAFGIVDSFKVEYTGSNPFNDYRMQFFYQSTDQDTMEIIYTGNVNQWDTTAIIRNTFDPIGNLLEEIVFNYSGSAWVNTSRKSLTYDASNRIIIQLIEQGDSLGGWGPLSRDSTFYDTLGNVNQTSFAWNGSYWECYEFHNIEYLSPTSIHEVTGMFDGATCSLMGYYSDFIKSYDSEGRLLYFEYNGHAGSSGGFERYQYDSTGFLYQSNHSFSSMGGLTNDEYCVHYMPLLYAFNQNIFTVCNGDSLNIIASLSGGAYVLSYEWEYNNQLLPDTTPSIIIIGAAGWYSMMVSDTAGNYYRDSILVVIQPLPNLGNDTSLCISNSLILDPGIFSNYQWQNGSSGQFITAFSNTQDTLLYWVTTTDSVGCINTDSVVIAFIVCVGIDDPLNEILKIHPNPVSRSLYISNISGKEIQSTIIFNSIGVKQAVDFKKQNVSGNLELDVSELTSGIYFIEIISEDRRVVRKFVKH